MPPCSFHPRTQDIHRRMSLAKLSRQTGDTADSVYVGYLGSSFYSLYRDPIFSIFLNANIFFEEASTIFLIAEQDNILFACFRTTIYQPINTMTMRVLKHISQIFCKYLCRNILKMICIFGINSFGNILIKMVKELVALPIINPK